MKEFDEILGLLEKGILNIPQKEDDFDNLYIVIHHLLVDGVSWRIITEDLNLAYEQLKNNKKNHHVIKTAPRGNAPMSHLNSKTVLKPISQHQFFQHGNFIQNPSSTTP